MQPKRRGRRRDVTVTRVNFRAPFLRRTRQVKSIHCSQKYRGRQCSNAARHRIYQRIFLAEPHPEPSRAIWPIVGDNETVTIVAPSPPAPPDTESGPALRLHRAHEREHRCAGGGTPKYQYPLRVTATRARPLEVVRGRRLRSSNRAGSMRRALRNQALSKRDFNCACRREAAMAEDSRAFGLPHLQPVGRWSFFHRVQQNQPRCRTDRCLDRINRLLMCLAKSNPSGYSDGRFFSG